MKTLLLFSALLACGVAASAQPTDTAEPIVKRASVFDAPVVSILEAQKLALPDDIQIHLHDVTLRAALQELQKQSGLPFDLSALAPAKLDSKISIDIDTPSVTRALDAIADEAGTKLRLDHAGVYDRWHVQENTGKATPRFAPDFVEGMFETRLLKVDVSLFKQLDLDAKTPERTQKDGLNLTLELTADPGWPIGGSPVVRATRADDDKGRSLLDAARAPETVDESGFLDVWSKKTATLQLAPPEPDARKIAHLEGEALYFVATKRARWELPDLLADKAPTYDFNIGETPVKTKILNAKIEDETVRFRLELTLPQNTNWQQFGGNLYSVYGALNWMTVEDASGARLIANGGGGSWGGNQFSSDASFALPSTPGQQDKPKLQLPLKFVFAPPTDWVQAQAKFKFDDVPLP